MVGGISVVLWYAFYQQIIMGEPFGQHPANNFWVLIFTGLFGIGLPLLLYLIHLKVEITSDELSIRFFPLLKMKFSRFDIISFQEVSYRPLREYGGWGIRYGIDGIKAYTVSGKRGVVILLSDNRKILVGSQKPEALINALSK